jgi:tRNA threonylcarbamoyladenosine biosynthesis protein TsaE
MTTVVTSSVEQTQAFAAAVASMVAAGDLVLLSGDLGAGKTAFVKGLAAELGVTEPVTSPTFTLAQRYEGTSLTVHHLDVYRLARLSEVIDLAIPELLDGDTVTLIEWGDVIEPALPNDYLEIRFELGDGADDRRLTLRPTGPRWLARSRALALAALPWAEVRC